MPDGGAGAVGTAIKGISAFGTAASGIGAVASMFGGKKPEGDNGASVMAAAQAEKAKADREKADLDAERERKLRMMRTGQIGRMSLLSNGDTGFTQTLGGG
jgi:hypothetical protein